MRDIWAIWRKSMATSPLLGSWNGKVEGITCTVYTVSLLVKTVIAFLYCLMSVVEFL